MAAPVCKLTVKKGIATITINRPDVHNALNPAMIELLLDILRELSMARTVRVVVLKANGQDFCVGADLKWLKVTQADHPQNNHWPGLQLAELMHTLYHLNKPTIALIQGTTYGGGIGLVACCDIALASRDAYFCFSEVRLGLIPAVISPYIVKVIGTRAARRYLLTAEHFSAQQAFALGLVHEVLTDDQLQSYADQLCQKLIAAGPQALARSKQLINDVSQSKLDNRLVAQTATWLAEVSVTAEAKEGVNAFLQKRPAKWVDNDNDNDKE